MAPGAAPELPEGESALALSIGDLALRVREFLDGLADQDRGLAKALAVDELAPIAASIQTTAAEVTPVTCSSARCSTGRCAPSGPGWTAFGWT